MRRGVASWGRCSRRPVPRGACARAGAPTADARRGRVSGHAKDIRMCATCTLFLPPKACKVVEGDERFSTTRPRVRLIVWNCNMALHRKAAALLALRPDVAVICEVAAPALLRARGADWLESEPVWVGDNPHK